jgi:hypothetical protein
MPNLTKRTVDAAEIQSSEYFLWDDERPGFGLRALASGRKGYLVQHRAARGRDGSVLARVLCQGDQTDFVELA